MTKTSAQTDARRARAMYDAVKAIAGDTSIRAYEDTPQEDMAKVYKMLAIIRASDAKAGMVLVPRVATDKMLSGARDWSVNKYSQGIGNDAAIGCWCAMIAAHEGNGDA